MPPVMSPSCPVCGGSLRMYGEECRHCGCMVYIIYNPLDSSRSNLNKAAIQKHIADFRQRIRTNGQDEDARYGLGVAYYNLELYDDAARELEIAKDLVPENPDIRAQFAVALMGASDPSILSRYSPNHEVQIALKLNPIQPLALYLNINSMSLSDKQDKLSDALVLLRVNEGLGIEAISGFIPSLWRTQETVEDQAVLEALKRMPEHQSREILSRFLARNAMGLVPVTLRPTKPAAQDEMKAGCGFYAFLIGLPLIVSSAVSAFDLPNLITVVVVVFSLLAFIGNRMGSKEAQENETTRLASTVTISSDEILNPKTTSSRLFEIMELLRGYRQGEMERIID
ncbi:MAG: hypothetical protein M9953_10720 [Thermomicrobiales bacterium]|nr:hypothetical protein [Thermomicrobiales bacterium]MCO5225799.1 hypothetical protein [Thermomicrobiales bacterium]MCO5226756.1 hypothetical protein [Thermomicrobiales bacterium]